MRLCMFTKRNYKGMKEEEIEEKMKREGFEPV